ncbi:hypothetical protein [Chitinivorax sp. B]|uniref:hypothetical protein n=1 Tax=Chitinivorax sp. B TaxID=2502235 RepID=UPI0010F52E53|nr:hypothetical protein [Chitinivorax sp. B]
MATPPPSSMFRKDFVAPEVKVQVQDSAMSGVSGNASPYAHILPTASLMTGLCLVTLVLVKLVKLRAGDGFMDVAVAINATLYFFSAVLSFFSMRSGRLALRWEKASDVIFLIGLLYTVVIALLYALDIL